MIDKDRASALLAEQLEADLFVMATDVDAVYTDWGTPRQGRDRDHDAGGARRDVAFLRDRWAPRWRRRSSSCERTGQARGHRHARGAARASWLDARHARGARPACLTPTTGPVIPNLTTDPSAGKRAARAPSLAESLLAIGVLVVMISTTVLLFGTDATGGPLQVALMISAVIVGLLALRLGHGLAHR